MAKKKVGRPRKASSTPRKKAHPEVVISAGEYIDLQNRYISLLEKTAKSPSPKATKKAPKKAKKPTKKAPAKKVGRPKGSKAKTVKSSPKAPPGVENKILQTLQKMQGDMDQRGQQLNQLARGKAQ